MYKHIIINYWYVLLTSFFFFYGGPSTTETHKNNVRFPTEFYLYLIIIMAVATAVFVKNKNNKIATIYTRVWQSRSGRYTMYK